ncbi:hypothetical protein ACJJIC_15030 [Microbulbifer sp. ANSA002]|uniref:hypothetical protein n=1 Tax=unclassified Microbulbifer TaxID=2619833 RepID=UPI0040427BE9
MNTFLSFIAAIFAPAFIVTSYYLYGQFMIFEADDPYIWVRTSKWLYMTVLVSGAFVFSLGGPAFFLLKKFNFIKWWSTIGTGFILGAAPVAVFTLPTYATSASVNGVQTVVDGVRTLDGWFQYVWGFSYFGALGMAGALAFWLVWRHGPNKALYRTSR